MICGHCKTRMPATSLRLAVCPDAQHKDCRVCHDCYHNISACERLETYAKANGLDWTIYYGPGIAPGDDVAAFRLSCDGGDRSVIGTTPEECEATIRMTRINREGR